VLGLFATGVTVLTTTDPASGQPHGMTANAFMSVSLEPPLVLASVRRDAHLHRLLELTGRYGVSILSDSCEREARRFAGMAVAAHEPPPAFRWRGEVPILSDVLAWLVTRVVDAHPAGDHTLFIGEILDLEASLPDRSPLGFYRSTFAEVALLAGRDPVPLDPWEHPIGLWG
jgi:flavin reductase (DIM6/NTAB) family NADH-FMN oxidoreductase RutF